MSVKAKIIIDDEEINALWFSFGYQRHADVNGRPTTKGVFLGLRVAIESRRTLNLAYWAFAPNLTKEIELHISSRFGEGRTRKLKLYDCHLLRWDNRFTANGSQPMHEILHISAGGVKDNNSAKEYSASWRKTFDMDDVEPTTLYQEESEVLDCYYTDSEGNEDTTLEIGKEVYLVLKTENMVGETKDIDLSNNKKDFEYQGEVLEDDIIKDFHITSDLQKIKLKIIAQQETATSPQK